MLGKLFKHEMRATARIFLWLYIAFVVIAVLNALFSPHIAGAMGPYYAESTYPPTATNPMDTATDAIPNVVQAILMTLYFISIVVISIVTFVVIILRFFRNLLGDEGYLMMTLPVSREQHMLSKLLVAVLWSVCTIVLVFLSFLLFAGNVGFLGEITRGLQEIAAGGLPVYRWIAMFVLALVVGSFTSILMLYAAMAIGPNLLKNRVGGSILAFIMIYVASQFATVGVVFASLRSLIGIGTAGSHSGAGLSVSDIAGIDAFAWSTIAACAAIGACCWFLARFMLKRKLNLG